MFNECSFWLISRLSRILQCRYDFAVTEYVDETVSLLYFFTTQFKSLCKAYYFNNKIPPTNGKYLVEDNSI